MIGRSSNATPSSRVRGTLWLIAGVPMVLWPAFIGGGKGIITVGMMSMIFGISTLRRP